MEPSPKRTLQINVKMSEQDYTLLHDVAGRVWPGAILSNSGIVLGLAKIGATNALRRGAKPDSRSGLMPGSSRLHVETELYETRRSEWLKNHCNQFAVVKGKKLLGFFNTFHEAYSAGAAKYGTGTDFLVKRVVLQEPIF